tara:strand:- start:291 stop:518 length:228 start_codon:yes stop_codon:yes gene_type:complete
MLKNLTDEPEMTTEAKAQCRLAALHQLDNVSHKIKAISVLLGRGDYNPILFSYIQTALASAERLAQLGQEPSDRI